MSFFVLTPSSKLGKVANDKARELGWNRGGEASLMGHASVVMVRCPTTGHELSTGVEMDTATFERLPDIHSQMKCPVCGLDHGQRESLDGQSSSVPPDASLAVH